MTSHPEAAQLAPWLLDPLHHLVASSAEEDSEFDRGLVELLRNTLGSGGVDAFRLAPGSPPIELTGSAGPSQELLQAIDEARDLRRSIVRPSGHGDAFQWVLCVDDRPRYAFASSRGKAIDGDGVLAAIEAYVRLHRRLLRCQRDLDFYRALVTTLVAPAVALRPGPLTEFLSRLAALAAPLARVRGAMVIAIDEEGAPIGAGGDSLSVRNEKPYLDQLLAIIGEISRSESPRGGPLPAALFRTDAAEASAKQLRWWPIRDRVGYLILTLDPAAEQPPGLDSLADALAQPIRAALAWEANQRVTDVQNLLVRNQELQEVSRHALASVVGRLREIFAADAVSLFLRTRDRLRLAATTDQRLLQRATAGTPPNLVEYHPEDPQLTSYVFRIGRSLRLKDSVDPDHVASRTGMTGRTGPRFAERDLDDEVLIQFLAAPVRRRGEVTGVLRMSRRADRVSFTRHDEEALQLFGDLVGVFLAEHDETSIVKSILRSTGESILVIAAPERGVLPTIEIANEGAVRVFGRDQRELRGLAVDTLFASENLRQMVRNKDATGELVEGDVLRPDGSRCTILGSFWRLENTLVTPSATRILSIARDVTELRREHKRYLDLLANMGVVYFRGDPAGRTLVPSEVEAQITGYSVKQLRKMNRADLFFDRKKRAELITEARLAEGGTLGKRVVKWKHASGRPLWIETDFRVYSEPDGSEIVEGVYREVTYQIELRRFLNEQDDQLDDARLFKKLKQEAESFYDYLPSFAHQLQDPLVAMRNTAHEIKSGELEGDELRQRLDWVIGQTNVCIDLVKNHSYLNKVLRGEKFAMAPVDVGVLVIRVKNDFLHRLQERRLTLTIDNRSLQTLRAIQGHEALLRQVVVNLLDNAIKYSSVQTTIAVRARRVEGGTELTVSNRGLPIDDSLRPRLFNRGVRGWRAAAVIPEGTGLGLWLVKKILDTHGATIEFVEQPDSGGALNVFRITFRS
jgi:signal transduction histidine kinase